MTWLIPSVTAIMTGTFFLIFIYCYLYLQDRKKYLILWAAGWVVYLLRFVFMLFMITAAHKNSFFLIGSQLCSLTSGVFLLWGTYNFMDKKFSRIWFCTAFAGAAWIILSVLFKLSFLLISLPAFSFLSLIYLWTGILFLRSKTNAGIENSVVGTAFILWGIHVADYPFLRPVLWFAPFGYIIGTILEFIVSLGLLLVYFRKTKSESSKNEENLAITLDSIGDAVITTDSQSRIVRMNPVAEHLTGWIHEEALGMPLNKIFNIVNTRTLQQVDNPVKKVMETGKIIGLANHTMLISKNGKKYQIADSAAPIQDDTGNIFGIILVFRDVSYDYQMQQALQQSEEKFRLAFHASPDAINLNSAEDGIYIDINEGFTRLMGYSRKDVIGKAALDLNIWNDIKDRKYLVSELKKHGAVDNLEANFIAKNGKIMTGLLSARLLTIDNKNTTLFITRDITEKKQAEDSLKESEQRFRRIYENMAIGVAQVSLEFRIESANNAYCRMLGYSEDELIGKHIADITGKEILEKNLLKQSRLAKGEIDHFQLEKQFIHKNGNIVHGILDANLIRDSHGRPLYFLDSVLDITHRKLAEKAVQESEEKYRSMMEAMDDTLHICSSKYIIEYMNPAMIKKTGHDATGETCYKAIYGLNEKCPWCVHKKIMKKESSNCEIINPKDNKAYHLSTSPVYNTDGSISLLTISRDISEFRKITAQLQQAQKMEAIGVLAGGIAHDFNNILFPILGYSDMLLNDIPEDSPLRKGLDRIHKGAIRARDLVKQILTFSRQDIAGLKPMKLQPIIKEALKLMRSTIPATIDIEQEISNDCGEVNAEPTQIHQIIMNLTTNAYHAMMDTGGLLKVSLKEVEFGENDFMEPDITPGLYACLIIADTGVGMNKEVIDKIFDPFFTTKEKDKGTGMGLSVVHGIVKTMNGTIRVYSEPDGGTEFHVYFPLEKNSLEPQESSEIKELQKGRMEKIFLVDDNELILMMEEEMLNALGYQVISNISSLEALKVFRADPYKFDLIITDMEMPDMSGEKLAMELIKIRPDIPILLCTGFSETMSKEKATSLGIKGFLLKPVMMKELSQKICEILN